MNLHLHAMFYAFRFFANFGRSYLYPLVITACLFFAHGTALSAANPNAGTANNPAPLCYAPSNGQLITLSDLLEGEDANGLWTLGVGSNAPGTNFTAPLGLLNTNELPVGIYYFVYTVSVPGCGSDDEKITIQVKPLPEGTASVINASCFGIADGLTSITATVGTPPFMYNIGSGDQPANIFIGLGGGNYSVTVTDFFGCQGEIPVFIAEPPQLIASASVTNANCGNNNGSITIIATGGLPQYHYDWADLGDDDDTPVRNDLTQGGYLVTVSDTRGCTTEVLTSIAQEGNLNLQISTLDVECNGYANGAIDLNVTEGTPPYTFDWDDLPGANNIEDRNNLHAGLYWLTLTDNIGCSQVHNILITEMVPVIVICSLSNPPSTTNSLDGSVLVNIVFNSGFPMTAQWNGPSAGTTSTINNTFSLTGLMAGYYTITVTNNVGCTSECNVLVSPQGCGAVDSTEVVIQTCDPAAVGIFTLLFANSLGCDSVVIYNTMLLPIVNSTYTTTCDPAQVGFNVLHLTTPGGCDSVVIETVVLVPTDTTYIVLETCNPTQVGSTQVLLTGLGGCDSLVVTNTVLTPIVNSSVNLTCDPAQVGFNVEHYTTSSGCDSVVLATTVLIPADTTIVQKKTCNPAFVGSTVQVFQNLGGCDSLLIVNTVLDLNAVDTTYEMATTCQVANSGSTETLFTNVQGCDSLVITVTSFVPAAITTLISTTCDPAQAGVFAQPFPTASGCDSIVVRTVTLIPADTTFLQKKTCDPAHAGIFQQLLPNEQGCDSLLIINYLYEPNAIDTTVVLSVTCTLANEDTTQTMLVNLQGCDSLVITRTAFFPGIVTNLEGFTCHLDSAGSFAQAFPSVSGCDSIVITTLTLIQTDTMQLERKTCNPTHLGLYEVVLHNVYGCDSLLQINYTFDANAADTTVVAATTCQSAQVGSTQQLLTNSLGCDSLVITATTLMPPTPVSFFSTTCDPTQVGVNVLHLSTQAGCDSIVILTVALVPADTTFLQKSTCDPAQAGTSQQVLQNLNGCDSVLIVNTLLDAFTFSIRALPATCFEKNDGKILLESTSNGSPPFEINLGPNPITILSIPAELPGLSPGNYSLMVFDSAGCVFDSTLTIASPDALMIDLAQTVSVAQGDSVQLLFTADFQIDSAYWGNTPGLSCTDCEAPFASPTETTFYAVTALDSSGCLATASIQVQVTASKNVVYVPNAFAPDKELFTLYASTKVEHVNSFQVYDRWGNAMWVLQDFAPNDTALGWNGQYKGKVVNPGVYAWWAEVLMKDGEVMVLNGDVLVVR